MEAAMIPMRGRQVPTSWFPGFDARYHAWREADERPAMDAAGAGSERLSLAERIEQALLEAERLYGD
jgi:hypothetical protein